MLEISNKNLIVIKKWDIDEYGNQRTLKYKWNISEDDHDSNSENDERFKNTIKLLIHFQYS